jgi:hypothetical protein
VLRCYITPVVHKKAESCVPSVLLRIKKCIRSDFNDLMVLQIKFYVKFTRALYFANIINVLNTFLKVLHAFLM